MKAGQKHLNIALAGLVEHGWLSGLQAGRASRSYVQVGSTDTALAQMRSFDCILQRLETLWAELCACAHKELLLFTRVAILL